MRSAFMTANYVARETGYKGGDVYKDWGPCHERTVNAFHSARFAEKFEELVADVKEMGFDTIELWSAHLDPTLATENMLQTALAILRRYEMQVVGYTVGFGKPGTSRAEAIRVFETARELGVRFFAAGFHPDNGEVVKELAQEFGIYMALENHGEKTATEVISKVSDFAPWIGSALDTGWFATQGYDPVRAVYELQHHLIDVHLKDIEAAGAHDTCALGDGIVDVQGVLRALKEIGYQGNVTIEHEPLNRDPTEDVRASLARVTKWWNELSE